MLVIQCRNCKGLNVSYDGFTDLKCLDCGYKSHSDNFDLHEVKRNHVINLDNPYWVSKKGVKFEFDEMSKEYLKNVINLLKRTYSAEELKNSNLFSGITQEYMLRVFK